MIIRKDEFAEKLAQKRATTKKEAREILDDVLNLLADEFEHSNDIDFAGFGKFTMKELPARTGVNPQTGENVEIPAHKKIKFTPKKNLKEKIG